MSDYEDYYEDISLGIHKINNALHEAYSYSDKSIYNQLVDAFPAIIIAINCLPMNELQERYLGPATIACKVCEQEGHFGAQCDRYKQ